MQVSKVQAISNWPAAQRVRRIAASASPRARLLTVVWLLFVLLVAFGVHGSSTALTADGWMPEKPYTGYVFGPSPEREQSIAKVGTNGLRSLLLANARYFRWDEAFVATPYALSQLAHLLFRADGPEQYDQFPGAAGGLVQCHVGSGVPPQ